MTKSLNITFILYLSMDLAHPSDELLSNELNFINEDLHSSPIIGGARAYFLLYSNLPKDKLNGLEYPRDIDVVMSSHANQKGWKRYLIQKGASNDGIVRLLIERTATKPSNKSSSLWIDGEMMYPYTPGVKKIEYKGTTVPIAEAEDNLAIYGLQPVRIIEREDRIQRTLLMLLLEDGDPIKRMESAAERAAGYNLNIIEKIPQTLEKLFAGEYELCDSNSNSTVYIDPKYPIEAPGKATNYVQNKGRSVIRKTRQQAEKMGINNSKLEEIFDSYRKILENIRDKISSRTDEKKVDSTIKNKLREFGFYHLKNPNKVRITDCGVPEEYF